MISPVQTDSAEPAAEKSFASKVYLAVWRWHFWSGLIIAPVLIVVSITGALYVFKAELERVMYPNLMFSEGGAFRKTGFDQFRKDVEKSAAGYELRFINVSKDSSRNWEGFAEIHHPDGTEEMRRFYFDPNTQRLVGSLDNETSFFRVVLKIHRQLFAGTFGRFIVEASTCWGIVSVLAGLWLWLPRKKEKIYGVWIPRFNRGFRAALRDLHTVPGMYFSIFILLIMLTGLLFTNIWGKGFRAGIFISGGFPEFFVSPPKSAIPEGKENPPTISIDSAVAKAFSHFDFSQEGISISIPHTGTDETFNFLTPTQVPLADRGVVYLDAFSGETLVFDTNENLPWQTRFVLAFYPIHVGSIFGLTTKILAVLSCLLIIAMSVTGVWMWWRRRKPGTWGAPKKTAPKTVPRWMAWLTVGLAIFLPTVGLTLILIFLIDWAARKLSKPQAA